MQMFYDLQKHVRGIVQWTERVRNLQGTESGEIIIEMKILFRGYNIKNAKWIYGYYFVNRGEHFIIEDGVLTTPFLTADDFKVEETSVCQYTGLTDCKGNKIFEGDILSDGRRKVAVVYSQKTASFVAVDIAFVAKPNLSGFSMSQDSIYSYNDVVVGNIHDNHEILKGRKEWPGTE